MNIPDILLMILLSMPLITFVLYVGVKTYKRIDKTGYREKIEKLEKQNEDLEIELRAFGTILNSFSESIHYIESANKSQDQKISEIIETVNLTREDIHALTLAYSEVESKVERVQATAIMLNEL